MLDPELRAIHLAPGEGATVRNPVGGPLTFKLRGADTNGTLAAFESTAAPGEGPPLHVHANEEEVWYALEGTFRFKLEAEVRIRPGRLVRVHPTWRRAYLAEHRGLARTSARDRDARGIRDVFRALRCIARGRCGPGGISGAGQTGRHASRRPAARRVGPLVGPNRCRPRGDVRGETLCSGPAGRRQGEDCLPGALRCRRLFRRCVFLRARRVGRRTHVIARLRCLVVHAYGLPV